MDDIPDLNLFMVCRAVDRAALREMPEPYRLRTLRPSELATWKGMPFDGRASTDDLAFMDAFMQTTYGGKEDRFFATTWVVCDPSDRIVATCLLWDAYDELLTVHWFKVVTEYEGLGIGRALLSHLLRDLPAERLPIYLHTQPGSYRAIKLYSDFGFELIAGDRLGSRTNDLEASLPILERTMPPQDVRRLRTCEAPAELVRVLDRVTTIEF